MQRIQIPFIIRPAKHYSDLKRTAHKQYLQRPLVSCCADALKSIRPNHITLKIKINVDKVQPSSYRILAIRPDISVQVSF